MTSLIARDRRLFPRGLQRAVPASCSETEKEERLNGVEEKRHRRRRRYWTRYRVAGGFSCWSIGSFRRGLLVSLNKTWELHINLTYRSPSVIESRVNRDRATKRFGILDFVEISFLLLERTTWWGWISRRDRVLGCYEPCYGWLYRGNYVMDRQRNVSESSHQLPASAAELRGKKISCRLFGRGVVRRARIM